MRSFQKLLILLTVITMGLWVGRSGAIGAPVRGVLVGAGSAKAGGQLHFENQVTHDIYMAVTGNKGDFFADLPSGLYSLRKERGAILVPDIAVGGAAVNLGTVIDPGWSPFHLFQLEGVAEAIVKTPAPSTAYLPAEDEQGSINGAIPVMPGAVAAQPVPRAHSTGGELLRSEIPQ